MLTCLAHRKGHLFGCSNAQGSSRGSDLRTDILELRILHSCVGDHVIVIAEDDDSYAPLKEPAALPEPGDACPPGISRRAPERVLFCGWRRDMHDMIAVLDAFVYPGSELWLYNEVLSCPFQALGVLASSVACCKEVQGPKGSP